jgi:hypothetical protein
MAAPAHADSDSEYWQTLSAEVRAGPRIVISNETVLRMGGPRGFYEAEDNLMVGYKLDPHVTVSLGYTHDPNYIHGSFTVMEQRFRQQVGLAHVALGPATLGARLRLEERWRRGQSGTGWRLRPYVRLAVPIAGKTALFVSHESFIDLGTTSFQTKRGEERMRNMIGINQPLSKHLGLEVGYLEQHVFVAGGPDADAHVASVALTGSF